MSDVTRDLTSGQVSATPPRRPSLGQQLVAAGLLGAATGGRTFTGLAVLAATAPEGAAREPDRALGSAAGKGITAVLALGEIVGDKLPQAPPRTEPPGLTGRLVTGAFCGVVVARRTGASPLPVAACAVTATAGALATSFLGVRWRSAAADRLGHDWIGAVLEDGVVVATATAGARLATN